MDENELSNKIVGAAIEVHRTLGPGLLESTYEGCLCHELALNQIPFERQALLPVIYKGIAEDFIEKAEITQIMATIIFALFAVRFLYYPNKSENFYLSGKKVHHKENQPQRAQSSDIFFSVYSVISVVFQIKKINQRKPIEKELITCN